MLRHVDGFSHYSQAFMAQKWDVCEFGGAESSMAQSVDGVGRPNLAGVLGGGVTFATNPAGFTNAFQKAYMQWNYDGVGTVVVGLAVKQTGVQLQVSDSTSQIHGGRLLTFMAGNSVQVRLTITQSGQIEASRGVAANLGLFPTPLVGVCFTILGTSTSAISSSSFDFLEVKVVHHPTTGSIEIRRNGVAFWTLSNVNTDIAGSGNSSSAVIGGGHWGTQAFAPLADSLKAVITDVHILDTVVDGSDALNPVDFIGDRHWEPISATADGADTAWTITGSANHFANIDEVPPNTTDFNSTATLNARDGFIVSSPTGPSTATALVALTCFIQKNTGGSNEVKGFARSGAPAYRNGTGFQVPTPWGFRQSFFASKPGGGAITIADVGSFQWGVEKTI